MKKECCEKCICQTECECGSQGEHCCNPNCPCHRLGERMEEDWQEVFKQFYDNNDSGGSSRWLVTPGTVKIFIKGLLFSRNHEVIQELNKIAKWVEPQPGAGKEIGALYGAGMYAQYDHDRKQHEDQIAGIINKLTLKK